MFEIFEKYSYEKLLKIKMNYDLYTKLIKRHPYLKTKFDRLQNESNNSN